MLSISCCKPKFIFLDKRKKCYTSNQFGYPSSEKYIRKSQNNSKITREATDGEEAPVKLQ